MRPLPRRAFTPIELLVVIAIIAVRRRYTPDLVKLEPRHSPETEGRRCQILEDERRFIEHYEYADTWGHAVVKVRGGQVHAEIYRGLDRQAWQSLDLTGPLDARS